MIVLWCFVISTLFVALVALAVAVRNRINLRALTKVIVDGLTIVSQTIDQVTARHKASEQAADDEPTNPGISPPTNLNKDLN